MTGATGPYYTGPLQLYRKPEPEMVEWSVRSDPTDWNHAEPEIPVTHEMVAEGRAVCATHDVEYISQFMLIPIYRAMATKAPKESSIWASFQEHRIAITEAANAHLRAVVAEKLNRVAALEAENAIWVSSWNKADQKWAAVTVECEDAKLVIAAKDARIAELKSQLAAIQIVTTKPTKDQQTDSDITAAADVVRRPDGTLAPSKPWQPPKTTVDQRRIGG